MRIKLPMKSPTRSPSIVISCSILTLSSLLLSSTAFSAGFGITENSGSGMGNAYAGAAATAEDASTVWFNPAGMTYLGEKLKGKAQILNAGHIISGKTEFRDKGSKSPAALNTTLQGDKETSNRVTSFVPNLYYVRPINERLQFGIGVNGPFGSKTTYDRDWIGRYQATNTDLLTININPSLSYKVNDKLSLGGGISGQYVKLKELSSAVDSAAVCRTVAFATASATNSTSLVDYCNANYPNASTVEKDSQTTVEGDGFAFGFNVGLLFQPTNATRIGLSYRSKIKHDVEGTIKFKLDPALEPVVAGLEAQGNTRFTSRDIEAQVTLPESVSLSLVHKIGNKLELLGDVTWTGWSAFDELRIKETDGVTTVAVTPEEWEDVTRYSLGANYNVNDKLTLRTGVAFDEEPIPSAALRTPRIPGNDRTWLSIGAGYQLNKHMKLDVGYSHLYLEETPIDNAGEDSNGFSVRGLYNSRVDIISAQVSYTF